MAVTLCAGQQTFELRGRIAPKPGQPAAVTISGAYSPFMADTVAGADGKFKFKKLPAGTYNLTVAVRHGGTVRQTVEVAPGTADRQGRVEVTIPLPDERIPGAVERRNTVGVKELAIPAKAKQEYAAAVGKLGRRDIEGARADLAKALELAPQYAEAWNLQGTIAYQTQQYADAEKYFRKALEIRPGAYIPMLNLGGVLINLGRCQEGLEYNQRAVKERPHDALANAQLGMTYYCLMQDTEAVKYLEAAKRFDPASFSNPQLTLGDIYERQGRFDKAAAELEDFLRRRPGTANEAAIRQRVRELRARH